MSNATFNSFRFSQIRRGDRVKMGYETYAAFNESDSPSVDDFFTIYHHGHRIAEIAAGWVYVTNAGWGSSTTRNRLNRILTDNGVPIGVGQKNFEQVYYLNGDFKNPLPFSSLQYDKELQAII